MASVNEDDGRLSESTSKSTPEKVKKEADKLVSDLNALLAKHGVDARIGGGHAGLMSDLCIYIVERDYKTLEHGRDIAMQALREVGMEPAE